MAVFSALKNKKNQKMREGIEDLAIKCSEPINEKEEPQIQVDQWIEWKWIYFRLNAFYYGLDFSHNEYKLPKIENKKRLEIHNYPQIGF